jgi:hypothetical protein
VQTLVKEKWKREAKLMKYAQACAQTLVTIPQNVFELNDELSGYGWDHGQSVHVAVASQSCYDHDHVMIMGITLRLLCIDMLLRAMINKVAI